MIKSLGVSDPDQERRDRAQEREVMRITAAEGIEFLESKREQLAAKFGTERIDRMLELMRTRADRQEDDARKEVVDDALGRPAVGDVAELRRKLIRHQREILMRERDSGTIDEEVMREVLKGLDAEELAMDTSILHGDRG